MAKIKPLRQSELFQHLSDREIAIFSQAVMEEKIDAGKALPERGRGLILVKSGSIEALCPPDSILLGPGDYVGELSLLCGDPAASSPVALKSQTACEFLRVTPESFETFLGKEPGVALRVLQGLSRSLRHRLQAAVRSSRPQL